MKYLVLLAIVLVLMLILILLSRYVKRKSLIDSNMYIAYIAITSAGIYYGILNQIYEIILNQLEISNVQNKFDYWVPGVMIVAISFTYYMTGLQIHIGKKTIVNGNYFEIGGNYINKVEKYEDKNN